MPEAREGRLWMRPRGLEERIFGRGRRNLQDWWFRQSPRLLLDTLQMLSGGIWPAFGSMIIFSFCAQASMTSDSMIAGVTTPLTMLEVFAYAYIMPWITCRTYKRIWEAQQRVRKALNDSDIVLRILFGWQPDYGEEGVNASLRSIEGQTSPPDLHTSFFQVGGQLSYWLGVRSEPRPPLPLLKLVPLLFLLAGQLVLIPTVFSFNGSFATGMLLSHLQFLGGLAAFWLANELVEPLFEQQFELYLLREHLREIDYERFEPRQVTDLFAKDDNALATRERVRIRIPEGVTRRRVADG